MTVDASFYLEAASGHFLFGEDDSSAATTNRRSPYGGMADFGDARTGRLATICDRDLWGTERLCIEKDQIYQMYFQSEQWDYHSEQRLHTRAFQS